MTESINWIPAAEKLPDSDTTVLIYSAAWDEPTWFGFFDGEGWKGIDHYPAAAPTHWADMPVGPAK